MGSQQATCCLWFHWLCSVLNSWTSIFFQHLIKTSVPPLSEMKLQAFWPFFIDIPLHFPKSYYVPSFIYNQSEATTILSSLFLQSQVCKNYSVWNINWSASFWFLWKLSCSIFSRSCLMKRMFCLSGHWRGHVMFCWSGRWRGCAMFEKNINGTP